MLLLRCLCGASVQVEALSHFQNVQEVSTLLAFGEMPATDQLRGYQYLLTIPVGLQTSSDSNGGTILKVVHHVASVIEAMGAKGWQHRHGNDACLVDATYSFSEYRNLVCGVALGLAGCI
jgi:hypothetical protein